MILPASPESRYFRVGQEGTRTDLPLHDGIFPIRHRGVYGGNGKDGKTLEHLQSWYSFFVRSAQARGSMEVALPQVFRHGWKRLRKNDCSVRCASLRACLRQSGFVYFQQLSGTNKLVP
jgi:hypothetical protein